MIEINIKISHRSHIHHILHSLLHSLLRCHLHHQFLFYHFHQICIYLYRHHCFFLVQDFVPQIQHIFWINSTPLTSFPSSAPNIYYTSINIVSRSIQRICNNLVYKWMLMIITGKLQFEDKLWMLRIYWCYFRDRASIPSVYAGWLVSIFLIIFLDGI